MAAAPNRSKNPYLRYYAALVYGDLGDIALAASELSRALEAGFPASVLAVAPELDSLRGDRRVDNLIANAQSRT